MYAWVERSIVRAQEHTNEPNHGGRETLLVRKLSIEKYTVNPSSTHDGFHADHDTGALV